MIITTTIVPDTPAVLLAGDVLTLVTLLSQPGAPGTVGVSSVTGTAPVVSSGGLTPAISMPAATSGSAGHATATQITKIDGIEAGAQVNKIDWANPVAINTATALTISKENIVSDLGSPADYTVTLPDGSGLSVGDQLVVTMALGLTKIATVDGFGAELINGVASVAMWAKETLHLEWNGTGWTVLVDGRIPMSFFASNSASQLGLASAAYHILELDTEGVDVGGVFNPANHRFYPRRSNNWLVNGYVSGLATAGNLTLTLGRLYEDGSAVPIPFANSRAGGTYVQSGTNFTNIIAAPVGSYYEYKGYLVAASGTVWFPLNQSYLQGVEQLSW